MKQEILGRWLSAKLNIIEVVISKALMNANVSHGEFVYLNDVLKEYNDKKGSIKNPSKKCYWYNKNPITTSEYN